MTTPTLDFTPPTADAVIAKVREIAAEAPAFVYSETDEHDGPTCRYVKNGEGSCIVGKALVALGVPVDFFDRPSVSGSPLNTVGIWQSTLRDLLGWQRDLNNDWLQAVQAQQDVGCAWGIAVEFADKRCPLS